MVSVQVSKPNTDSACLRAAYIIALVVLGVISYFLLGFGFLNHGLTTENEPIRPLFSHMRRSTIVLIPIGILLFVTSILGCVSNCTKQVLLMKLVMCLVTVSALTQFIGGIVALTTFSTEFNMHAKTQIFNTPYTEPSPLDGGHSDALDLGSVHIYNIFDAKDIIMKAGSEEDKIMNAVQRVGNCCIFGNPVIAQVAMEKGYISGSASKCKLTNVAYRACNDVSAEHTWPFAMVLVATIVGILIEIIVGGLTALRLKRIKESLIPI